MARLYLRACQEAGLEVIGIVAVGGLTEPAVRSAVCVRG